MTAAKRIGVFYSESGPFWVVLRELRRANPSARLCAIVPAGFVVSDEMRSIVDEVVVTPAPRYSPRNPGACVHLVKLLRAGRFDLFIVLFRSAQLRLLAALCGATRAECWDQYNRITVLSSTPIDWALGLIARRTNGAVTWLRIWLQIHLQSIKPAKRS